MRTCIHVPPLCAHELGVRRLVLHPSYSAVGWTTSVRSRRVRSRIFNLAHCWPEKITKGVDTNYPNKITENDRMRKRLHLLYCFQFSLWLLCINSFHMCWKQWVHVKFGTGTKNRGASKYQCSILSSINDDKTTENGKEEFPEC